jgi:hypothetical protein
VCIICYEKWELYVGYCKVFYVHRNTVGKLAKRSTFCDNKVHDSRSEWPRVLKRRSAAVGVLGLRVRIPLGAWIPLSCESCVYYGYTPLMEIDPLSREFLPSVCVCVCVYVCVIQYDQVLN